jgi:CheY-like chemotaxis protein/two-component sensor histidine kinase
LTHLLLRRTDGELSIEQERQVGYIRKAANDLTEMVNDLLDLARVESGKTEVHMSRIHLGQLFGALRGLMRPLVPGDSVTLIFEEPPDDLFFDSDESKMAQILRNLVANALKFTEHGEVRVASEVQPGLLKISVTDTGIGIAPEDQDRIFQEFAQVTNPIQKRVKGTGLGLPLSRKLANLLGGELTVTSQLGHGATFYLTIPNAAHLAGEAEGPADCILIIDDEETSRYLVRQRFRGTRYRLLEASGGVEGAERARFERPALIILDIVIPDRSGFDVLDDLKGDPATSGIPVMIHTSRRLGPADFDRLAGRHAAILPKGEFWPLETMEYIRALLGEPSLFSGEVVPGQGRT